jgi:hypothetical protein
VTPSSTLPVWWAKVKRGQEHRDALEQHITKTFAINTNLPTLTVKFDPDTSEHVLYVKRTPDLTEFYSRVGLIFGDCINNFRAALDYIVYEMGARNTSSTGGLKHQDWIKFPIVTMPNGWAGVAGKELGEVSAIQRTEIQKFQPYHGRDLEHDGFGSDYHPLAMLRKLTDIDKHRLLTAVVVPLGGSVVGSSSCSPRFSITQEIMLRARHWQFVQLGEFRGPPVELGAEIARAKLPDDTPKDEVEMAGHVYPLVTLAEVDKRPVLPVVDTLAAMVVKILRELEPTL